MLLAFYRKIGRNHLRNSTPQKLSFFQLLLLYGISHKNSRAGGILGWALYYEGLIDQQTTANLIASSYQLSGAPISSQFALACNAKSARKDVQHLITISGLLIFIMSR